MYFLKYILLFLFFSSIIRAQTSPALDDNYVTLQPAQTFKGYYGNAAVGWIIKNMGIMAPGDQYGSVFLNSVDTLGYGSTVSQKHPLGLFKGGSDFSLFKRSEFRLDNVSFIYTVFNHGKNRPPIIIANKGENGGMYFACYPLDFYSYPDSNNITLTKLDEHPLGASWRGIVGCFDKDTNEDLLMLTGSGDSTYIAYWDSKDIDYKGITSASHLRITPMTKAILLPGAISTDFDIFSLDLDGDKIPDLALVDTSGQLEIILGKRDAIGDWQPMKVNQFNLPFKLQSLLFMDFLWSDGIPDLILQSADTIYCYNGKQPDFLVSNFDFTKPDLAIPSPAHLDPHNFNRDGDGGFGWFKLFDAGNINGSGDHSLLTFADYFPVNGSLDAISYGFFYSGGKAADEKADAIISLKDGIYSDYSTFDTVQGALDEPMNMLLGDYTNTAGGTGRLDFVAGSRNIPHNTDSRWTKGVINRNTLSPLSIQLLSNPVRDNAMVSIQGNSWQNGLLNIRNILDRVVYTQQVFAAGQPSYIETLSLNALPVGVYIIEFSQNHSTVSTPMVLTH